MSKLLEMWGFSFTSFSGSDCTKESIEKYFKKELKNYAKMYGRVAQQHNTLFLIFIGKSKMQDDGRLLALDSEGKDLELETLAQRLLKYENTYIQTLFQYTDGSGKQK